MTIEILVCALALVQAADPASPAKHVANYLKRCDEVKAAAIDAKQAEIKSLAREQNAAGDGPRKLQAAQAQLKQLQEQPAGLAKLPLPPKQGDMGIFEFGANGPRGGPSLGVLEVVDEDDAILRAWYVPADSSATDVAAAVEATFVDLWVHGIDTSGLSAGSDARLSGVFHVTGNKTFDTTCGGRSLPAVEPIDIKPYRN